jgi:hypothetical protein
MRNSFAEHDRARCFFLGEDMAFSGEAAENASNATVRAVQRPAPPQKNNAIEETPEGGLP